VSSVAVLPSLTILAGSLAGIALPGASAWWCLCVLVAWACGALAWRGHRDRIALGFVLTGYAIAGLILASDASARALSPSLRVVLDKAFGGFDLDASGPGGPHEPMAIRARLVEDAVLRADGVSLRLRVESLRLHERDIEAAGGIQAHVSGAAAARAAPEWTAGRTIAAPATFRRPARYLNDGVPDAERGLALTGITLFATIKSALLVDVAKRGSASEEMAARVRAHVRVAIRRHIGSRDPIAASIITAILIGDRSGLPDVVRERLQAAGTYHVIAISGGNIAILAGFVGGMLLIAGVAGRPAAVATIAVLVSYAIVVTAGPSVWRATLMALVYLCARLLDHRGPPWNAVAVSAALVAVASPCEVADVGFALTFGATAAILESARRVRERLPRHPVLAWVVAVVAASCAVEIVLLPVGASSFSRVTVAGVALNLLAVPLMSIAQIAGLLVSASPVSSMADAAAVVGAGAAWLLVESARLVEFAPWLTTRVSAPPAPLVLAYYVALAAALSSVRLVRRSGAISVMACALAIVTGVISTGAGPTPGSLRLTMFDVGQGEALLLQMPGGKGMMVDAGGIPFGASSFDLGARVLAPALWARGVRRLDTLVVTHGDPDHIGGAGSVIADFSPRSLWEGVPVPGHAPLRDLLSIATAAGAAIEPRRAGMTFADQAIRLRVLHPAAPDWERQKVRNDDSVVIEVLYGDVAILLTGDIGADVERALIPHLTQARIRILKAGHHGSRTSTSRELLNAWRPQVALISCGRGNAFGHPAPEVLRRLDELGVRILRTDRDGQITLDTDGTVLQIRTFRGGQS
jgi:competence protein ComEC